MPASPSVAALLEQVRAAGESYQIASAEDSGPVSLYSDDVRSLARAAQQLADSLKPAEERIWTFLFQPSALACANIAFQCGLLGPWPTVRMSSSELADLTKADQKLVARVMRALCLHDIFKEVEEELYEHTVLSETLSSSSMTPYYKTLASNQLAGVVKLPEWIASISYRNPGDDPSDKTYFQYANNTPLTFFQFMQQTPVQLAGFQKTMAAGLAVEHQWDEKGFASLYPFEELISDNASADEIVLVEVGGGHGHVIKELRATLPKLRGHMVLEDLPAVVKGAPAQDEVQAVPYNFFTEKQPVEGARAYLFRHVLLDWSDSDCRKILLSTIPAMRKGRSKILVAESILPPMNPTPFKAMMDVTMMRFEGTGRKEKQWRELFKSVGLHVVKIWPGHGYDSVMELVPEAWIE